MSTDHYEEYRYEDVDEEFDRLGEEIDRLEDEMESLETEKDDIETKRAALKKVLNEQKHKEIVLVKVGLMDDDLAGSKCAGCHDKPTFEGATFCKTCDDRIRRLRDDYGFTAQQIAMGNDDMLADVTRCYFAEKERIPVTNKNKSTV